MQVGARIRTIRNKKGMTQEVLADSASLHRNFMSGIETGKRNISVVTIVKIARALETTPSKLLDGIK
jgi:transcriptional regulator with XRE-family HTH domain